MNDEKWIYQTLQLLSAERESILSELKDLCTTVDMIRKRFARFEELSASLHQQLSKELSYRYTVHMTHEQFHALVKGEDEEDE